MWASTGSDKRIYGKFVCPSDPRFSASTCGVGFGRAGEVPTIDAQAPVLVWQAAHRQRGMGDG